MVELVSKKIGILVFKEGEVLYLKNISNQVLSVTLELAISLSGENFTKTIEINEVNSGEQVAAVKVGDYNSKVSLVRYTLNGETFNVNEELVPLTLNRILAKDFYKNVDDSTSYVFYEDDSHYICTCGQVNHQSNSTCIKCGKSKEECKQNFTSDYFNTLKAHAQTMNEKKEEKVEEFIPEFKPKKKKKNSKKGLWIAFISVIALIIIACAIFFGMPFAKLLKADSLVKQDRYEEAIAIYEELGKEDKVNDTYYTQAKDYLALGKVKEGFEIIVKLDGYSNSVDYLDAYILEVSKDLIEENKFEEAYYIIQLMPDISNLNQEDLKTEVDYHYALYLGEKGYYEEALELLEEFLDYENARDKYQEFSYELGMEFYEKEEYDEAVRYLVNAKDYKDALDIVEELSYDLGKEYYDKKEYEDAIFFLENADQTKEVEEMLLEAKYQYVKANYKADNVKTYEYFRDLYAENYKDSRTLYSRLYTWKVELTVSNSAKDKENYANGKNYVIDEPYYEYTFKALDPDEPFYFHYNIVTGIPEQELDVLVTIYDPSSDYKEEYRETISMDEASGYFVYDFDRGRYDELSNVYFKIIDRKTEKILAVQELYVYGEHPKQDEIDDLLYDLKKEYENYLEAEEDYEYFDDKYDRADNKEDRDYYLKRCESAKDDMKAAEDEMDIIKDDLDDLLREFK